MRSGEFGVLSVLSLTCTVLKHSTPLWESHRRRSTHVYISLHFTPHHVPLPRPTSHATPTPTPATTTMSNANNTNGAHDAQPEYHFGNPPPQGNEFVGNLVGVPPAPVQDPSMRDYRGYSLAQPFNLVERIRCGRPMFGYGLLLGSPYLARCVGDLVRGRGSCRCRITGAGGYDFIFIDWEHTPMSESYPGFEIHVDRLRAGSQVFEKSPNSSVGFNTPLKGPRRPSSGVYEIHYLPVPFHFKLSGSLTTPSVPNADHQWIAWVLDAGASAVLLPHVSCSLRGIRHTLADA